jgi:AcrR family transcriptional regulator
VALISRYFGGKEQLFKEVLREGKSALPSDLTPSELPAYLAQLATEQHFDAEANCYVSLLMILRSASSPQASAVVRNALKEDILGPLSSVLGNGEEASTAASLATAILMGTAILRVVAPVQAICPCEVQLRQRLEALFAAALKQPAV